MGKRAKVKREKKAVVEKERKAFFYQMENEKNPWINFWKRFDFWVYSVCILLVIAYPFLMPNKLKDLAIIHTSMGDIEVEFYKNDAPKAVENMTLLSQKGYYNNLTWHRVIKSFMIQGGDPGGDGRGGESAWGGYFDDEINPTSLGLTQDQISQYETKGYKYNYSLTSHKMQVGSLAMANAGPNTNGSQFFIVTEKDQPHLDGQHTVFGHVIKGLDVAVKISEVAVDENDKPKEPVLIKSIEME